MAGFVMGILWFCLSLCQYLNPILALHSFNVSVPLKVGCTAPIFVLSFFLHSILFAGSALDSFQCLRSLLIVSFHVFFGLPRPRCPTTSNSVMLLIQPSFLTTCPNQRFGHARSLRCSLSRSLTLGAQHSLAYNKTVRIYVLYICPLVMYERACEVNIGKSSRNLPHADRILVKHSNRNHPQHRSYLQGSRMNQ